MEHILLSLSYGGAPVILRSGYSVHHQHILGKYEEFIVEYDLNVSLGMRPLRLLDSILILAAWDWLTHVEFYNIAIEINLVFDFWNNLK